MSKIVNKKKISFISEDDDMYEGLLGLVQDFREEIEENIQENIGSIEETDDEIIVTLNKLID